jgi:hypothetical protein
MADDPEVPSRVRRTMKDDPMTDAVPASIREASLSRRRKGFKGQLPTWWTGQRVRAKSSESVRAIGG